MDKLGVETEKKKKDLEKESGDSLTCPSCGTKLSEETNVPYCPKCGTKPFEKGEQ